jgi:ABC-type hemin transport system substrate-binding protein
MNDLSPQDGVLIALRGALKAAQQEKSYTQTYILAHAIIEAHPDAELIAKLILSEIKAQQILRAKAGIPPNPFQ